MLTLLIVTVAISLLFDVINGFHDAANSIATVVSTRVLRPGTAVLWAAFCNFIALLIFEPRVAETISHIVHITPSDPVYIKVILAGVLGAIAWDLFTWWLALPTSSSHALIGGFAGAGLMHGGWEALYWSKLFVIFQFIFIAPLIGMAAGILLMIAVYWLCRFWSQARVNSFFRKGQLVSASLYAIGHGGNDAQKTMGLITAVMIAAGHFSPDVKLSVTDPKTLWIILACHLAMALGTAFGGWRIMRTMGMRIAKLVPISGFCAESAGAATLFFATMQGIPVSTTHTITGAIIGVGTVSTPLSHVRWGLAAKIVWSWILTLPFSGLLGALFLKIIL